LRPTPTKKSSIRDSAAARVGSRKRAPRRHAHAERLQQREVLVDHVTRLRWRHHPSRREERVEPLATPADGEADAQRRARRPCDGARLHEALHVDGHVEPRGA
jgi:hypothetical protein